MKIEDSPEVAILLLACTLDVSTERKEQLSQFLNQRSIDWDLLYKLAVHHRIQPFLYRTFQEIPFVSAAFLATLLADCRTIATDNLLKLHHYQSVKALLVNYAIDYLPLKGIYFAEQDYPDSSLRIVGDVDLLVRKEDVFKAILLIQQQGYQLNQEHALHWRQGNMLADLYEVSLIKSLLNGSHFDIDLHWNVPGFNRKYALFNLDYVRSPPDLLAEKSLILLVAHHGVTNVWKHIYYINDLYFSLHTKSINWPWLMRELRQYGFERVFLVGLYWCEQIWKIELPSTIRSQIASSEIRVLAEEYTTIWKTTEAYEFSRLIVRQLLLFTKAQTHLRKKMKIWVTFLSSRVFRYSLFKIGERKIYVPKQLGFVTLFVRIGGSLCRFSRPK
ncbi:hypothetical protein GCM10028805_09690 [Spirosoma harenae]